MSNKVPARIDLSTDPLLLPRKEMEDIVIQIAQNAAGAAGVAGLVGLFSWLLFGAEFQAILIAGATSGLAVFCLALTIRAFLDEGQMLFRAARKEWKARTVLREQEEQWELQLAEAEDALEEAFLEIQELEAQARSLRNERDMVMAELSNLRHQVASERSTTYRSKVSVYEKPRRDAKTLMQIAIEAAAWPARDKAIERLNWTRERWESAFQVLRDSGVVRQTGIKGNHVRLLVTSQEEAFRLIDQATGVIAPEHEEGEE